MSLTLKRASFTNVIGRTFTRRTIGGRGGTEANADLPFHGADWTQESCRAERRDRGGHGMVLAIVLLGTFCYAVRVSRTQSMLRDHGRRCPSGR